MALGLPLLAGVALSLLLGGRLSRLGDLSLRWVSPIYAAIALQLVVFPVSVLPWRTPDRAAVALWLVSYGLFALAAARNLRVPGVPLVAAGMVSNLAGSSRTEATCRLCPAPCAPSASTSSRAGNSAAMASPHPSWLVDRGAAPDWVPFGNVYSLGDVLIALGGFLFALAATGALERLRPRRPATMPKVTASRSRG